MQTFTALGRLVKDPETTQTNNGTTVCKFNLAVRRNRRNNDGQYESDFFNTVIYGKIAEVCSKYLKKGSQVQVVGEIQTRNYEAKDGSKRYVTELFVDNIEFAGSNQTQNSKNIENSTPKTEESVPAELEPIDDDSLPF